MVTFPSIYLEDQLEIRGNLHANSIFDVIFWVNMFFNRSLCFCKFFDTIKVKPRHREPFSSSNNRTPTNETKAFVF